MAEIRNGEEYPSTYSDTNSEDERSLTSEEENKSMKEEEERRKMREYKGQDTQTFEELKKKN